jgi:hypothetical protein
MSEHRKLLVFRSKRDPVLYQQQMEELQTHHAELRERDVVIVEGDEALQRDFHVPPDEFALVLIGKDGGEKLRRHTLTKVSQLSVIIDAMPMRQAEMRRR